MGVCSYGSGKRKAYDCRGGKTMQKATGKGKRNSGMGRQGCTGAQVICQTCCQKGLPGGRGGTGKATEFWGVPQHGPAHPPASSVLCQLPQAAGAEDAGSSKRELPAILSRGPSSQLHLPGSPWASQHCGAAGLLAARRQSDFPPHSTAAQPAAPAPPEETTSSLGFTPLQARCAELASPSSSSSSSPGIHCGANAGLLISTCVPARCGGWWLPGHLLTQGRNQAGTFPGAAPGSILTPRTAPDLLGCFCSDIFHVPVPPSAHTLQNAGFGGGEGELALCGQLPSQPKLLLQAAVQLLGCAAVVSAIEKLL